MTDLIDKLNSLEGKTPDEIASALKPSPYSKLFEGVIHDSFSYSLADLDVGAISRPDLRAFAAAFRDSGRFFDSLGSAYLIDRPVSLDRASRRGRL